MKQTQRILRRVLADDANGPKCRCGLRRAYIAHITFEGKNRFGLPQIVSHTLSFCTMHGKAYGAKFKLEVTDGTAAI